MDTFDVERPAWLHLLPHPNASPATATDIAAWIEEQRSGGMTFRRIADLLNDAGVPTRHGGRQWWASSVRAMTRDHRN